MYNLLVSANRNDWRGKHFSIPISRCINKDEYTDETLAEKYGKLNISDIKELKEFPCIFAYEEGCRKNPKFGYIKQILKGKASLEIDYKMIGLEKWLTHSDIQKLKFELSIPDWELSRTHWALKETDLADVLQTKGIKLPTRDVSFRPVKKIIDSNNKNVYKRGNRTHSTLQVSGNENVFLNSHVYGSATIGGKRNRFLKTRIGNLNKEGKPETPWYKKPEIMVPAIAVIIAAIIGASWWSNIFSLSPKDDLHITPYPTHVGTTEAPSSSPIIIVPTPNDNVISISNGESYTDPHSKIVVGLLDVSIYNKANISITVPEADTSIYEDVVPGKVFYFTNNNNNYSITIKSVSYVGGNIKIIIATKKF